MVQQQEYLECKAILEFEICFFYLDKITTSVAMLGFANIFRNLFLGELNLSCTLSTLKLNLHLSFLLHEQERGRERQSDHVGMRTLLILLSQRKVFLSVWSWETLELSSCFSCKLNGKAIVSQSNHSASKYLFILIKLFYFLFPFQLIETRTYNITL